VPALVDVDGKHIEDKPRGREKFGPAGRSRGKDQSHGVDDKLTGMRPIGTAIPGAIAELLQSAAMSPGKIAFAWKAAAGPAFAKVSAVHLEGTELLIDPASHQWAQEIRRASPLLLRRLQTLVGADAVTKLTIRPPQGEVPRTSRTSRTHRT
jgi:hypothetical protein